MPLAPKGAIYPSPDPRSPQEIARIRQYDPLTVHGVRLAAGECEKAEANVSTVINDAFARADADPFPVLGDQVKR